MTEPLTPDQFRTALDGRAGMLMNTVVAWIYEQNYAVYEANAALLAEMRTAMAPKILSPAEKTSALMGMPDD